MEDTLEIDALDEEYVRVLRLIKPYITCIMNNEYIELIKMWLEKLSADDLPDKYIRNSYLRILSEQIQKGYLVEPFASPPTEDDLEPIVRKSKKTDNFQTKASQKTNEKSTGTLQTKFKKTTCQHQPSTSTDFDIGPQYKLIDKWKHQFNEASRKAHVTYNSILYNVQNYNENNNSNNDDSSWMDVSDDNASGGDAPKTQPDQTAVNLEHPHKKIENLLMVAESLKTENRNLVELVNKLKCSKRDVDNKKIIALTKEVESLKTKLQICAQELMEIKTSLQNSHCSLNREWQNIINFMNDKLALMYQKNSELHTVIIDLQNKLNESTKYGGNNPQTCVILSEMHKKEMEMLKQKHKQALEKMESNYNQRVKEKSEEYNEKIDNLTTWYDVKVSEVELETEQRLRRDFDKELESLRATYEKEIKRLQDIKVNEVPADKRNQGESHHRKKFAEESADRKFKEYYEGKLQDMQKRYEEQISLKNSELKRLEAIMQEQCKSMKREVETIKNQVELENNNVNSCDKIAFLQKCILKMDKLFRRAEKEFCRQIVKLKKDMEVREKHTQILLSTQRVRLISSNAAIKQREIDDIVTKLEDHYKTLLKEQHAEAIKERKQDQKIIAELRELLALSNAKETL